jgi:hypothetical protein
VICLKRQYHGKPGMDSAAKSARASPAQTNFQTVGPPWPLPGHCPGEEPKIALKCAASFKLLSLSQVITPLRRPSSCSVSKHKITKGILRNSTRLRILSFETEGICEWSHCHSNGKNWISVCLKQKNFRRTPNPNSVAELEHWPPNDLLLSEAQNHPLG